MQNNMQNNQDLPRKRDLVYFLSEHNSGQKRAFYLLTVHGILPCTHGWDEKRVINLKLDRMIKVYLFQ